MGNSILPGLQPSQQTQSQKPQTQKQQQQYSYISDRKLNIVGNPRVIKSNITGIQLEEYFIANPQNVVELDSNIYRLRSSSYSKNIAVVFNHKLVNEIQKLFVVRVQKMKGRLNQIDGLTVTEALCLLEASLNGFSELVHHAKTPFVVTQKMIAINDSSYVRVWLHENFALNKVMPGIKIRNQNIMIHQIFSAINEHVATQQRQAFSEIRFKIAQFQRLVQAKNVIVMILQNTNRKVVLQELINKQMTRLARQMQNGNMNMTYPLDANQAQNIKIPMNMAFGVQGSMQVGQIQNNQGQFILNPNVVPNAGNTSQGNSVPVSMYSPMGGFGETAPVERVQITTQEYIKDDQGADRIRMIRQEHNTNIKPASSTQNHFQQQNQPKSKHKTTPLPSVLVHAQTQKNQLRDQKVSSNNNNNIQQTDRNIARKPAIFNQPQHSISIKQQQSSQQNIDINNLTTPRNHSPIRFKQINNAQIIATDAKLSNTNTTATSNITSKIALSQNKITHMENKINRLKQELSKNNYTQQHNFNHNQQNQAGGDKRVNVHFGGAQNNGNQRNQRDNSQKKRTKISMTPPHGTHRSPAPEQGRPVTKLEKAPRMHTETAIGATAAKWQRKLIQIEDRKKQTKQLAKTQRNSQIFIEQRPVLNKSMISQPKKNQTQSPAFKNLKTTNDNREHSPAFAPIQAVDPLLPKQILKPINGVYGAQQHRYIHPQYNSNNQQKVQISFTGNAQGQLPAGYRTTANGYAGVLSMEENRSAIFQRKSHF